MEEGHGDGTSAAWMLTAHHLPRCAQDRATEVQMTAATEPEPRFDAPVAPAPSAHVPGPGAGIVVDGVSLTFRGARTVTALEGISLDIASREVVALIGPNGCGKSTLLRVLAGLIAPDGGRVALDGVDVSGPDPRVGMVFQEPRLLAWRTVEQNVRFPLELADWSRDRQEAQSSDLLGLVGLREFAHAKPSTLSGGTRQRVAIARALALEPSVLLLDEPFSALDALTRERFNAELLNLWQRTGTTIVLVTHSIPEAVFLADRVVVLSPRPGRVVAEVAVPLPRPRRIADLDTASVSSIAAEIRAHLVDTTDDAIALAETRAAALAGGSSTWGPHEETAPGTPAWFDPFRPDDDA
jgi:NitT/TauT family transport system ATP-binding protein